MGDERQSCRDFNRNPQWYHFEGILTDYDSIRPGVCSTILAFRGTIINFKPIRGTSEAKCEVKSIRDPTRSCCVAGNKYCMERENRFPTIYVCQNATKRPQKPIVAFSLTHGS